MELILWISVFLLIYLGWKWLTGIGYDYTPPKEHSYRRYEATMEAIVEKYPNGVIKSIDDGIVVSYFDTEGNFFRQVDKKKNQVVKKTKVEV